MGRNTIKELLTKLKIKMIGKIALMITEKSELKEIFKIKMGTTNLLIMFKPKIMEKKTF